MNRKKLTFILLAVIVTFLPCLADNPTDNESFDIPMMETPPPSDNIENPSKGARLPQRPVMCTISRRDGVLLQSTGAGEIISYEIRTADGQTCLFVSDSEASFIEVLFQMQGDLLIIFQTETTIFSGYLTM